MSKKLNRPPERRPLQQYRSLTFIPNLFRRPPGDYPPFDVNDPFIRPEILQDHSTLLATNDEGVPNFTANNPTVDDIIDFSEDDWKDITKIQVERENREKEAKHIEDQQKKQKEAADSQMKQTLDCKVDQFFNKHCHFIRKTCPVMIPFKSSLNHEEHKAYLRAFVKFKIRPPKTAVESAEYENYLRLQNRVYEEQQCFMTFSYQVARLQLKAYNEVPEVMNTYISEYVQERCKRVFRYKSYYIQEQPIPICPQDPTNKFSDLYFNHVGHLLSLGCVPWIRLPNLHTLCKLPVDDTIKKRKGFPDEEIDDDKHLHKIPVSEDPNAVYLAKKHQANIVVSTSALKIITDNPGPNFDKEWDIPVVVRTYTVTDSDGTESSHRVVFIDKPMPKKIWTPSEKKKLFYKKSALSSMTEIKRLGFFRMKCPLQFRVEKVDPELIDNVADEKITAEYSEDFLDLYSATDHDIFGPSSPSKKAKYDKKIMKKNVKAGAIKVLSKKNECEHDTESSIVDESISKMNSSGEKNEECKPEGSELSKEFDVNLKNVQQEIKADAVASAENHDPSASVSKDTSSVLDPSASVSKDTSSVLDNLLDMQDTLLKPSSSEGLPVNLEQGEDSTKIKNVWPWSETLATDWDEHNESKNCKNWSGDNVHYQLFSMGFNNSKPYTSSQPLRVIVRHNLHGISRFRSHHAQSKAFVVYPKPEYQAYFGCEVNTLSEITQQWLELLVRPNTTLLQVRVCESTGEVLKSEEKTLSSILKEGKQQHISFAPQQPLATLYAVFNTVSALPTGNYILHHDIKTEAFIKLMKAIDTDRDACYQIYNLHMAYSSASVYTRTHAKPPWIAIDTHILTPFHLKHYKIPGTFPMENPTRKLSKREKKRIKEKAKLKQKIDELNKTTDNTEKPQANEEN